MRILIAEDDEALAKFVRQGLESEHYSVDVFKDGECPFRDIGNGTFRRHGLHFSARIRALIRRSHLPSESVLMVGDLKLDRVQHLVERAGLRIELTAKEFALLEYLMRHAGGQVTRSMIIENVWNLTFDTTTNFVDVYIFGRWQKVESLKSAIAGLGIQRVSDIAMSCGVLNMMPGQAGGIDPVVFWEHSLGCALVCRNFARKIYSRCL